MSDSGQQAGDETAAPVDSQPIIAREPELAGDSSLLMKAPPSSCEASNHRHYTDALDDPGFRNAAMDDAQYGGSTDAGDAERGFAPSQDSEEVSLPPVDQCQYSEAGFNGSAAFQSNANGGGNNEACYSQNFQQTLPAGFQAEVYQQQYPGQEQGAYEQTFNEARSAYSTPCMAQGGRGPQCEVIDDNSGAPNVLPSPQQGFTQPPMASLPCPVDYGDAPSSEQAVVGTPCAVTPLQQPVPGHPHGYQAGGPAGGTGSTSGYETQSNNSCSPYTPESLNLGSCDHAVPTTVQQLDGGNFAGGQAAPTAMSAGMQHQFSVGPAIMYSAPSNDSGRSKFLSFIRFRQNASLREECYIT